MIALVRASATVPLTDGTGTSAVVIEAPVNARRFANLAHALFEALGQTSAATGNRVTQVKHQVPLLFVALLSRGVRVVVVDHTERCGIASLTQLIHTAYATGVELVAVVHPPRRQHVERTFAAWPHREITHHELVRMLAAEAPPEPAAIPRPADFPRVPDSEFPHFLTQCRHELDPGAFAVVEGEYRRVLRAVRAEVEGEPSGSRALESMRRHLGDSTSGDHAVTIIRAATAAAFPSGLFITCDADRLRATISKEPYYRAREWSDWDALHTYRRPERATVAVLATLGLPVAHMRALTVGDAHELEALLPEPARVHLRRTVLHRELLGATDTDPLLTLADGRPTTTRWIREALLDIGTSTDLPADRRRRRPTREPDYQWATRLGIRVRTL